MCVVVSDAWQVRTEYRVSESHHYRTTLSAPESRTWTKTVIGESRIVRLADKDRPTSLPPCCR